MRKLDDISGDDLRILITGGAGFIGSALVRRAIADGHSVLNVDALTYAANPENLLSVEQNTRYSFAHQDIRNIEAVRKLFHEFQPNAVMHLAAESHVDRSIDAPANFVETNIIGTFNMLEASLSYWETSENRDTFRFLHVSTDEVYGSLPMDSGQLFNEETPYDPQSPYSASKASSDHLVRSWHATFGLPTLITNCSNNYGPYHFPEKLIPVVILNALAEKPIPIYGDGSNIRDWLYVEDHADALLVILRRGLVGRSYNIGGNNEISNRALVQLICSILDRHRPRARGLYKDLIEFVEDRPGHDARYAIDTNRINQELSWKAAVTLEEGLEKTVNWYLDNECWWAPILKREGLGIRLGAKKR